MIILFVFSSVSSVINSAAANLWTDVFKDRLAHKMSEKRAARFTKVIGITK